ncbi:MAG: hypothetical protein ACE5J2_06995 [Nitrososphaerales archaeon]
MLDLTGKVLMHEGWRSRCINLIASENVTSPTVRTILASDLGHRYSLQDSIIEGNFYMGTKYIEEIVECGNRIAKKLFNSYHADLKLTSGHACAIAALMHLTQRRDSIMSLSLDDGGYPGYMQDYLPSRLNLHVHKIPFDDDRMQIDLDVCIERIYEVKPRLVVIAPSMITFATPLRRIVQACRNVNSKLVYDGSHILGLVAGKVFPNPLQEGTNVLLGSTHKSFPGPQGGIILTDKEHSTITKYLQLRVVDNPHFNRLAALIATMEEMLQFGKEYARQVVVNAKTLAKVLDDNGIEVLGKKYGYTETHQVLLKRFNAANNFIKDLEHAHIIVDTALRLGTCEVTRRGMKESDMRYIAELIAQVYNARKSKSFKTRILKVRREVQELASEHNKIVFTLNAI